MMSYLKSLEDVLFLSWALFAREWSDCIDYCLMVWMKKVYHPRYLLSCNSLYVAVSHSTAAGSERCSEALRLFSRWTSADLSTPESQRRAESIPTSSRLFLGHLVRLRHTSRMFYLSQISRGRLTWSSSPPSETPPPPPFCCCVI